MTYLQISTSPLKLVRALGALADVFAPDVPLQCGRGRIAVMRAMEYYGLGSSVSLQTAQTAAPRESVTPPANTLCAPREAPALDADLRTPYLLALRHLLQPDRHAVLALHREFVRLSEVASSSESTQPRPATPLTSRC